MQRMTWKRFVGIELVIVALFYLYEFLLLNNIVVRGKGFPAPLIDAADLPQAAVCVVVVILGAWLILTGKRKSEVALKDLRKPDVRGDANNCDPEIRPPAEHAVDHE